MKQLIQMQHMIILVFIEDYLVMRADDSGLL